MLSQVTIVPKYAARFAPAIASGFRGVTRRAYHENVIDHYENPRNVGSLDKSKKNVGTGE